MTALRRVIAFSVALITLASFAVAGEPGGFRPGLFAGEAAVAAGFAVPQAVLCNYLSYGPQMLGPGADEPVWFWVGFTAAYPFAMTGGTLLLGEKVGAPATNRGAAYLITTAVSLGGVGASAALGVLALDYNDSYEPDWFNEAMVGIMYGAIPNAFLNAYVYNRVKKPESGDSSSRFWAAPYVAAYRVGRDEPTPVYGLSVSF